ncbi:apomucin-like [Rhipicephalus sanguineus]|uniref:apomucin-like n=1 Tax=Rhipicephalus sanguineus TaxID=34632 RepID=UPI0020C4B42D|nr:apomucin-like [Rhipicephalus sanguineus]
MGACRSVEACGFPVESSLCLLKVFAVYAYDPIAKGCFMAYDCSLFGNKFPTARECQRTCEGGRFEALTQKIDYDSLLAAGQQRMVGPPGSFQSQTQIGGSGGVGLSQFPTGPGQLPGSTQVSGSNDSWNTSLQHQTSSSQQSSATSLTGTTISSTENGQQQGGHTSTGSQTLSTTAGGTTHVTGSQSSTGGGAVVIQTINGTRANASLMPGTYGMGGATLPEGITWLSRAQGSFLGRTNKTSGVLARAEFVWDARAALVLKFSPSSSTLISG